MFTGIIEEVGTVRSHEDGTMIIDASVALEGTRLGDSIAVNGVDLTVAEMDGACFKSNLMPETYRRSNLGDLKPGDRVNLERALTPESRMGGHLVRGVVEGTGKLVSLTPEADAIIASYEAAPELTKFIVVKGPIAIDGVSLTVIDRDDHGFAVSLVDYTQEHTNLTHKKPGDTVNLETDIIARYVEQLLQARGSI